MSTGESFGSGRSRQVVPNLRPATISDVFDVVNRSVRALYVARLPETTIIAANAAAAELYGETAVAMLGRRASSLSRGADEVHDAIALSGLAAGAVDGYCVERRLTTRSGVHVWVCVRRFDVDNEQVAVARTVPVDQPRPLDAVELELATATGIDWISGSSTVGMYVAQGAFAVLDRLSARQREILAALLRGERTPAIAASLFVSRSTVRSHLSALFRAFAVHSQAELLALLRSPKAVAEWRGKPPLAEDSTTDP
jgi:DNA-binding CsgD family transcriptional regulator